MSDLRDHVPSGIRDYLTDDQLWRIDRVLEDPPEGWDEMPRSTRLTFLAFVTMADENGMVDCTEASILRRLRTIRRLSCKIRLP